MYSSKYLFLLVPVLLCGCAHGFNRTALHEKLNDGTIQVADATVTTVSEARALKPQLRYPCRIAVYLKPSSSQDWRWSPSDKAVMDQWIMALKKEGIAAEVFPLPEMLTGKGETKELRMAAAQCGADALFIIHGAAQTDSYKNFAAVFNITLVGGYVVPGSHKDSLFAIEGILLDVDNGYVYTGVQTEGIGKIMGPTFVIEEKDSIAMAKSKAVTQFGEEVVKRMRLLAAMQAAAPTGPVVPSLSPVPVVSTNRPKEPTGITQAVLMADKAPTGVTTSLTPAGLMSGPTMPVPVPTLTPPPTSGSLMTGISTSKPEQK